MCPQSRKLLEPHARSHAVSFAAAWTQSTIADICACGVTYWPAPAIMSPRQRLVVRVALMPTPVGAQFRRPISLRLDALV